MARSSFYYWRSDGCGPDRRQVADARLAARMGRAPQVRGTYGVPRVTAELREAGERVNRKRIAWLMRTAGLAGALAPQAPNDGPGRGDGPEPHRPRLHRA
ncbi:IS3 family transposase [Streptomyces sp. NPDC093594]|uniref:IS3 family transposase n=1 Tax=Streptomyces sp. NPDC093594 TaxID=3155305 RepID=UPI00344F240D